MLHSARMGSTRRLPWVLLGLWVPATGAAQVPSPPAAWARSIDDGDSRPELSGAKLIDSVVALVGRRVITTSQLRAEARIALAAHDSPAAADGPLGLELLSSTLTYVISQDLIEEEASRLGVFPVAAAECEMAEDRLAARFPSQGAFSIFLARHDIDQERLHASVRRSLRAQRFLERQLGPRAQPTLAEVDAWVASHAATEPLARARAEARAYLVKRKFQALTAALVRDLRARTDVRVLASFASSPNGPPARTDPDAEENGAFRSALLDPPGAEDAP